MKNYKITVQYNGQNYCGWQKQPDSLGIQGNIENAIYEITSQKVKLIGSGRTDAGVHAIGQVANFNLDSNISPDKLCFAINSKLPKDICVVDCELVDENFHSRYSAKGKTYKYLIYNSSYRSPFYKDFSYQVKYDLNLEKMKKEAKSLIGKHDFVGFMSSNSEVKDTVRTIYDVEISTNNDVISIEITGDGFLYNMVRIIVGTLVDIGREKITYSLDEIINSKKRSMAGHTAPANGLFLKKVYY